MNVVLIAVDTLRADHLSCYGFEHLTSPHIDKLASQGLVFDEMIAPHIPTHPGYTTLFTGKDAMTHQIVSQGGRTELDPKHRCVAEILAERGYFTAAADNLSRWFARGFEVYEGYHWDQDPKGAWLKAAAVNETSLAILDACDAQEQPFFAFLHYWDPHTPYLPPEPFARMFYSGDEKDPSNHSADGMWDYPAFQYYFAEWMPGVTDAKFACRQYDSEIAYCDSALAHVFTRIRNMKQADDTLVIITSDHGEELDEHQMWFDHHGMYETNVHIPLIMACPNRIPAGKRLGGLVRHQDVAPTVLDFCGCADAIEEEALEGKSLLPLIDADDHSGTADQVLITECTWMRKRGLRTRDFKLIQGLEPDMHNRPEWELYDLKADPGEQNNLADSCPEKLAELQGDLAALVSKRMSETGLPDPVAEGHITLTRVGNVNLAVPANQILDE